MNLQERHIKLQEATRTIANCIHVSDDETTKEVFRTVLDVISIFDWDRLEVCDHAAHIKRLTFRMERLEDCIDMIGKWFEINGIDKKRIMDEHEKKVSRDKASVS